MRKIHLLFLFLILCLTASNTYTQQHASNGSPFPQCLGITAEGRIPDAADKVSKFEESTITAK